MDLKIASGNAYNLALDIDKTLYPGVLEYSITNGTAPVNNGIFSQTTIYSFPITAPTSGQTAYNLQLRFQKSNFDGVTTRKMNNKQYELTDHLGNVRAVVGSSLKKIGTLVQPTLIASTEYYPFGMTISSLSTNNDKYRYGFNGQEKDIEVGGSGNIYTAEFWEYDSRIARRWNLDPVKKPWQSDYVCFSNTPIWKIDPNGDDDYFGADGRFIHRFSIGTEIVVVNNGTLENFLTFSAKAANSAATIKILEHYKTMAGPLVVNRSIDVNPENDGNSTASGDDDGGMAYSNMLGIHFNTKGGVNKWFNDYNCLIDAIIHEGYHIQHGDYVVNPKRPYTYQQHLNVYNDQMDQTTFERTQNEWKSGVANNYARYLLGGIDKNEFTPEQGAEKAIEFNKKYIKYGLEIDFNPGFSNGRVILRTRGRTNEGQKTEWQSVTTKSNAF